MRLRIKLRTFLASSAVAAGGAVVTGCGATRRADSGNPGAAAEARVVPTYCEMCFWKCGVLATVAGDGVVSLAPGIRGVR